MSSALPPTEPVRPKMPAYLAEVETEEEVMKQEEMKEGGGGEGGW